MILPLDIHTHSRHSMDGQFPVLQMCARAAALNIKVYAITDHCEINNFTEFATADSLEAAWNEIEAAKRQYGGIMEILNGIELGQPLQDLDLTKSVLAARPYDFILGSLHNVKDRPDFYFFDYDSEELDLDKELEAYFTELKEMISWGGFDSLAHISYPFRYIISRYHRPFDIKRWDDHFDMIVKSTAEKGLALELNTAGIGLTPSYTLPSARWIKRFKEHGGEKLTLGSDAHVPEKIGNGIPEGVQIAKEAGFRYLTYFKERNPQYISIKDYL